MVRPVSISHWGIFAEDDETESHYVGPHKHNGIHYGGHVILRLLNPVYRPLTSKEFADAKHQ